MSFVLPDVIFYFPPVPVRRGMRDYAHDQTVNRWAWDRGWLPKDAKGQIEVYPGQRAEVWGGIARNCQQYLALKFV